MIACIKQNGQGGGGWVSRSFEKENNDKNKNKEAVGGCRGLGNNNKYIKKMKRSFE